MSERAQHLADRPRRRAHTFPNTAKADRYSGQQKTGVAQPGEVGGDQLTPPLALAALRSEVGGYGSEVFIDDIGLHRDPSLVGFLWAVNASEDSAEFGQTLFLKADFSLRRA
jgi:hypothetical protein